MNLGFISLRRKFFDHWLWQEQREYSKAEAWLDLIQSAAFANHSRMVRGALITLGRGEMIASLRYLGERWGWKKDKVQGFLKVIEGQTMIRRESRHGETVVILLNYDTYNTPGDSSPDTQPTPSQTHSRQATDSEPTKDNKGKKGNPGNKHNNSSSDDEGCLFDKPLPEIPKPSTGDDIIEPLLAAIWKATPPYGRQRSGKPRLRAELKKVPKKDLPSIATVTDALAAWCLSEKWTKNDGEFVEAIDRWVKERKWEDLPEPYRPPTKKFPGMQETLTMPKL